MKKKIMSLAFAAISCVAFTSIAQNPAAKSTPCNGGSCATATECVDGQKCSPAARSGRPDPFSGINLSDEQKSKLANLKTNRDAAKAAKAQAAKADRSRNDSVKVANRKADKQQYLAEVKTVLTPDQYVVFLENFYVNAPSGNNKAMTRDRRHGDRHTKTSISRDGKRVKGDMSKAKDSKAKRTKTDKKSSDLKAAQAS